MPAKALGASKLSVVDLFCGCGGLSLGVREAARAHSLELSIKLAVDNNASAIGVFRANLGGLAVTKSAIRQCDITKLFKSSLDAPLSKTEANFRKTLGTVDVLVAGPPCQGHSDLNNHTRRDDPRNKLYLRAVRAAHVLRPNLVIIENVPPVRRDRHNVVSEATSKLQRWGYRVHSAVLDCTAFGLPQKRCRHVLIATRDETFSDLVFPPKSTKAKMWSFINDIVDEPLSKQSSIFRTSSRMGSENLVRANYLLNNNVFDLPDRLRPPCHRLKEHTYVAMYGRMRPERAAGTITSGFGSMGQGRFLHPYRARTLTPHEAARLQGFPDYFSFDVIASRVQLQQMIGNAVPPPLGRYLTSKWLERRMKPTQKAS